MQPIETCTHAWNGRSRCIGSVGGELALVEPEAAARDPDAAGAEPVAEVGDRARAERDVDLGIELEDALALRLGVAAADGDHALGIAPLARGRLAEVGGELRVGLLADRAGVEDDDVGVGGASAASPSPSSSSMPLIRSESWAFIWQPKVVTEYVLTPRSLSALLPAVRAPSPADACGALSLYAGPEVHGVAARVVLRVEVGLRGGGVCAAVFAGRLR